MGAAVLREKLTVEQYLRDEKTSVDKRQYFRGEVFCMAGGSPAHSLITANVIGEFRAALRGSKCRVYDSNLRIGIPRTTLYTYPDASVICGPPEYDPLDSNRQTVLKPKLLVEVLSPATEAYDRGGKFASYRQIDSLQEYLLLSQDAARAETFLRQPDGAWRYLAVFGAEAFVQLASLGVQVRLAELYAGVEFVAPETRSGEEMPPKAK